MAVSFLKVKCLYFFIFFFVFGTFQPLLLAETLSTIDKSLKKGEISTDIIPDSPPKTITVTPIKKVQSKPSKITKPNSSSSKENIYLFTSPTSPFINKKLQ